MGVIEHQTPSDMTSNRYYPGTSPGSTAPCTPNLPAPTVVFGDQVLTNHHGRGNKHANKGKYTPTSRTSAGHAVDIFVPNRAEYDVVVDPATQQPYTAMLNQTNLEQNNNKFYLIQALKRVDGKGYAAYRRWGRVGYPGITELIQDWSLEGVLAYFNNKFENKTRNKWNGQIFQTFKRHKKMYTLLPLDSLTQADMDGFNGPAGDDEVDVKYRETKLEEKVYNLIKLICSNEMFERELRFAGLDLARMPLGRISGKMITIGYEILRDIEAELARPGGPNTKVLAELSGEFYTMIPHNFGCNKAANFAINAFDKIRDKSELLASLAGVRETVREVSWTQNKGVKRICTHANPIDEHYKLLNYGLSHVHPRSEEFALINEYKVNTQGGDHTADTKIRNVFKVTGSPAITKGRDNRMLLWHGSPLTNWMSILSHGLKIAPPEAPSTGYMFGKGVYTADCFSKAAQYCRVTDGAAGTPRTGIMVLCEVGLGRSHELLLADKHADEKLKRNACLSTKGVGKWMPDPRQTFWTEDGVIVPRGKLIPSPISRKPGAVLELNYNEYIVYDTTQVRMQYLVEVQFGK